MRHLSETTRSTAKKLGIQFPTPLPLFRGAPNHSHCADWAESQTTPMTRRIAHKVIEHLQYITFEQFLEQLQRTIDDFQQRVSEHSYVLLVGELRPDKLANGCSDLWIIGLALEYCGLKEPEAILTPEQLGSYLHTNSNVTSILMLDDAAYSGAQKGDILNYFKGNQAIEANKLSFYVGIPFMTHYAENALADNRNVFKELFFLNHVCMPSVVDILDAKELFYANSADIGYVSPSKALTYFDHRYADYFSCFQHIYDGSNLLTTQITHMMCFQGYTYEVGAAKTNKNLEFIMDANQYNTLAYSLVAPNYDTNYSGYTIPTIFAPYQLHKAEVRENLKHAITLGIIGNRSPYPVRDHNVEAMLSESILLSPRFFHYKKPSWPLEIQIGYDHAVMFGNQQEITYNEQVVMDRTHQQLQQELKTAFPILKPLKKQPYSYLQDIFNALLTFCNLVMLKIGLNFLLFIMSKMIYSDVSTEQANCMVL